MKKEMCRLMRNNEKAARNFDAATNVISAASPVQRSATKVKVITVKGSVMDSGGRRGSVRPVNKTNKKTNRIEIIKKTGA